jgi:hypothetical protein
VGTCYTAELKFHPQVMPSAPRVIPDTVLDEVREGVEITIFWDERIEPGTAQLDLTATSWLGT